MRTMLIIRVPKSVKSSRSDGVRVCFDDGWGLIRASNTQPALVLRFEATTDERLQAIRTYLEGELEACTQDARAMKPRSFSFCHARRLS